MPRPAARLRTYLVEQYEPGLSQQELATRAARIDAAAAQLAAAGRNVRYQSSLIILEDECLLSMVQATSPALIRAVFTTAGLRIDRVSRVVPAPAVASGEISGQAHASPDPPYSPPNHC